MPSNPQKTGTSAADAAASTNTTPASSAAAGNQGSQQPADIKDLVKALEDENDNLRTKAQDLSLESHIARENTFIMMDVFQTLRVADEEDILFLLEQQITACFTNHTHPITSTRDTKQDLLYLYVQEQRRKKREQQRTREPSATASQNYQTPNDYQTLKAKNNGLKQHVEHLSTSTKSVSGTALFLEDQHRTLKAKFTAELFTISSIAEALVQRLRYEIKNKTYNYFSVSIDVAKQEDAFDLITCVQNQGFTYDPIDAIKVIPNPTLSSRYIITVNFIGKPETRLVNDGAITLTNNHSNDSRFAEESTNHLKLTINIDKKGKIQLHNNVIMQRVSEKLKTIFTVNPPNMYAVELQINRLIKTGLLGTFLDSDIFHSQPYTIKLYDFLRQHGLKLKPSRILVQAGLHGHVGLVTWMLDLDAKQDTRGLTPIDIATLEQSIAELNKADTAIKSKPEFKSIVGLLTARLAEKRKVNSANAAVGAGVDATASASVAASSAGPGPSANAAATVTGTAAAPDTKTTVIQPTIAAVATVTDGSKTQPLVAAKAPITGVAAFATASAPKASAAAPPQP